MGETVQYKTPNGGNVSGYLATAAGSTKHVVVIQEWWGLNPQIRGVCDVQITVIGPESFHRPAIDFRNGAISAPTGTPRFRMVTCTTYDAGASPATGIDAVAARMPSAPAGTMSRVAITAEVSACSSASLTVTSTASTG